MAFNIIIYSMIYFNLRIEKIPPALSNRPRIFFNIKYVGKKGSARFHIALSKDLT